MNTMMKKKYQVPAIQVLELTEAKTRESHKSMTPLVFLLFILP